MNVQQQQQGTDLGTPLPSGSNEVATTGGLGGLNPKTLDEAMKFADILSGSDVIPKDYQGKPGNILVAIQWGQEIGLPPLQAMQNIAVINGRPTIWGDSLLALVMGSGALKDIDEESDENGATCTVVRKNGTKRTVEFTKDDAEQAGLLRKQGPWQQYPKRMMQMRARAFALRDVFPDVLRGVYVREEVEDEPQPMRDVTPEEAPKKSASKSDKVAGKVAGRTGRKKAEPKKDEGPTLESVLSAILNATTEDELKKAGEDAPKLSNEHQQQARQAYGEKLTELRTGKPDLEAQITADLNGVSGKDVDAVMGSYEQDLGKLEESDPEAYQRIVDLADKRAAQ